MLFTRQLVEQNLHRNALQYDYTSLMSVSDFQFPKNIPQS